jgi:RNA polymerase sigma-70 factor (ECF subfamily)
MLPISLPYDIQSAKAHSALKENALALTTEITETKRAADGERELALAARGDHAAFERLYRRYVTRVYRYCYSRTDNAADAEDLTGQTFVAALESIDGFSGRGSFAAWLFGIAWRKCKDFHRRRYRHQEALTETASDEGNANRISPEARAYEREILDCVQRHWRLLSEDRRDVLLLRFWAGLNTAETAAVMGRSRGAVKMLLSRAVADLRERCLDE